MWLPKCWIRMVLWLCKHICQLDYSVKGEEHITARPVIYAAKHQSAWETLALYLLIDKPCFIIKRELLFIPLIGWYLSWVGSIAINRRTGNAAIPNMLDKAKERMVDGFSIIVFPEGTRRHPQAPPAYRSGVRRLYETLGCAIVPVALNSGYFWARNAFIKKPGNIDVQFLPPIAAGIDPGNIVAQVQQNIEAAMIGLPVNK